MRPPGEVFQVKEQLIIKAVGISLINRQYIAPKEIIVAGTDIFVEADTDTPNTGVAGGFELVLVNDN